MLQLSTERIKHQRVTDDSRQQCRLMAWRLSTCSQMHPRQQMNTQSNYASIPLSTYPSIYPFICSTVLDPYVTPDIGE